jgi:cytochrome c-type biogenesis protein CcmH/NrfG
MYLDPGMTLVLSQSAGDPSASNVSESNIPLRAKRPLTEAMKALDTPDYREAARRLQAAVAASPKFAQVWHTLGVVDERLQKPSAARQAYERAMEAEPKLLSPYVMLARLCVKMKDWQCATKTADALIKADPQADLYGDLFAPGRRVIQVEGSRWRPDGRQGGLSASIF